MYDSCAQQYAHKYQWFLNLYFVTQRLVFMFFVKVKIVFLCVPVLV